MNMRIHFSSLFSLLMIAALSFMVSCKKDDKDKPYIYNPGMYLEDYTGGGTVKFQYSTDGGATYSATAPTNLSSGSKLMMKVNNGTEDLTTDDYTFDWSYSSLEPDDSAAAVVTFVISKIDFTPYVVIKDKLLLVSSLAKTGVFYQLDTATGTKTEIFTPKYNGQAITGVRAFTFHPERNKFYASTTSDKGGVIYEVNPSNKEAIIINDNNSDADTEWYGISNFAVLPDDSLIGIGWRNDPSNTELMKFNTDGNKSPRSFPLDVCCGLAMYYNEQTEELTISDNPENGTMKLVRSTVTGNILDSRTLYDLVGFPVDMSSTWAPTKALGRTKEGNIWAIMYNDSNKDSYLVRVNLLKSTVTYIATIGVGIDNQFNSLTFIPKHSL